MTVRRALPYLLALVLGVAAAGLVACGQATKGGIPAADAGDLKGQIEDVQQAVDDGRCKDVPGQLGQVEAGIDALPSSVDGRLRDRLRQASDRLRSLAVKECNDQAAKTDTQTQTEPPVVTETQPTVTETQPPTQTETQPPPQTEPPPPPQPGTTVPPDNPPQPAPDPGAGGTPPELNP